MWLGGWKSLVARMRWKGRAVRVLIVGAMVRPSGTAREPFWGGFSLTDILIVGVESCWFIGNGFGVVVLSLLSQSHTRCQDQYKSSYSTL